MVCINNSNIKYSFAYLCVAINIFMLDVCMYMMRVSIMSYRVHWRHYSYYHLQLFSFLLLAWLVRLTKNTM